MIDTPGPWGTGPFTVVEGHSVIDTESVVISPEPFAATYLWRENRTPHVRLVANRSYWDAARGPRLSEVVFRNDLSLQRALDLVCTSEGEVDLVTEVPPAEAARVEQSAHAKLVAIDAARVIVGVINRDSDRAPLADVRARQALNLAVRRDALVHDAMAGYAHPLAGLTPPVAIPMLNQALHPLFAPYPHDPKRAAQLWQEAGGETDLPLRVATPANLEPVARQVAADLTATLGLQCEVTIYGEVEETLEVRRRPAERALPRPWDLLIWEHSAQASEASPLEFHHAFVGVLGEYRAGPIVPQFDALFAELEEEISKLKQGMLWHQLDQLVYDEALALFLCAPQALYAVNKHVDFTPYRTTFELADCAVDKRHWSRCVSPAAGEP